MSASRSTYFKWHIDAVNFSFYVRRVNVPGNLKKKKKCKLKIDIPATVYYHILLNLETSKKEHYLKEWW